MKRGFSHTFATLIPPLGRSPGWMFLTLGVGLSILLALWPMGRSQSLPSPHELTPCISDLRACLPMEQVHPLPAALEHWQPSQPLVDDYLDQVQPSAYGYLIWSELPVRIYLEPKTWHQEDVPLAVRDQGRARSQIWTDAVLQAIADWNPYLPLTRVDSRADADITITEGAPALQRATALSELVSSSHWDTVHPQNPSGKTPSRKRIGKSPAVIVGQRARTAETRYELYLERLPSEAIVLRQRYHIAISPHQTPLYVHATALHELGHALGLWGHSLAATDALYASQVRSPQGLSERDINTLKQLYQQPTALGWPFPVPINPHHRRN